MAQQLANRKKKTEMDDVFGSANIGGYEVKPWTLSQFVQLSPALKMISAAVKEQGLDLSKIDLDTIDLNSELTIADVVHYLTMAIDIVGPALPMLIAVSVRINSIEAENLEWGLSLALVAKILIFNWEHIKNWLGQILGQDPAQILARLNR